MPIPPIEIEDVMRRYLKMRMLDSQYLDLICDDTYQLIAPRREVLRCKSSSEVTHPMNETKYERKTKPAL